MESQQDFDLSFEELDFTQTLDDRQVRRVYLVTYTQADLQRFPTCQVFTNSILQFFKEQDKNSPVQWACCQEPHEDGGKHYHIILRFEKPRRWLPLKRYAEKHFNIELHFSSQNLGYIAGYKYICKQKGECEVLHSEGHPNLSDIGSPKTKKCMKAFSKKSKLIKEGKRKSASSSTQSSSSESQPSKAKRLSNVQVAEFVIQNDVKDDEHLLAIANERHASGQKDLYQFIVNKQPKRISDLINTAWRINAAPDVIRNETMSRIEKVKQYLSVECIENCSGRWIKFAKEVLRNNDINIYVFTAALRNAIIKGRQKNNNILLIGPTNCGKSFLLDPLESIFDSFVSPAKGTYAWLGLDQKELAYLNEFRWKPEQIAWSDLLLLLEGATVHLSRPKNNYATDMCISRENKLPIFATSKSRIEYLKFNVRDDRESDMMDSRWRMFHFHHSMSKEDIVVISPCPHCFSEFIMIGSEED